ncbi:hypothetical protein V6N13_143305 [Hibiscus sabdariffa]
MGDGFGNWSLDKFHHLLPLPILLRIAANNGPLLATSKDNVGWNLRTDLQFSIKTAYVVRCGATTGVNEALWKVIHKFRGLQRVNIFLWLLYRNKLLTNAEMIRRHLMTDVHCALMSDKLDEFLTLPIQESLFRNLTNGSTFVVEGANWDVMFGSILWNIRHNQNVVVFEDAGKGATAILGDSKRITQSCCSAAAIIGPMGVGLSTSSRTHSGMWIGIPSLVNVVGVPAENHWLRPEEGWIKLNTDGGVEKVEGHATCGGVARDSSSKWQWGFYKYIGICSVTEA